MHTRAARLVILLLFLTSITTAAYLFWKSESLRTAQMAGGRSFDAAVRSVERALLDLRSAQRGYVAAGQGGDFWTARVAQGVDTARRGAASLKTSAISTEARSGLDEVASALDDFVRVDKRAVEYVRRNQPLLASDVIFADGLELTEGALTSLERARGAELAARVDLADVAGRRGIFAIVAGAAAAILTVLLLLPRTRVTVVRTAEPARGEPQQSLAPDGTWAPAKPVAADRGPSEVLPAPAVAAEALHPDVAVPEPFAVELPEPEPRLVPVAAADPGADFVGVAGLCMDLARVVDTRALPSLLDRAAGLLDASGIILWIADPDGRELNPIFAQGYAPQLINRLGTIPREAENATAAAFRTSLLQTVMADEFSPGAIAAPLVTPGGCVGVMAAEVRHDAERHGMKLAAATIVAAQLATLVGPPAARSQAKAGAAGA